MTCLPYRPGLGWQNILQPLFLRPGSFFEVHLFKGHIFWGASFQRAHFWGASFHWVHFLRCIFSKGTFFEVHLFNVRTCTFLIIWWYLVAHFFILHILGIFSNWQVSIISVLIFLKKQIFKVHIFHGRHVKIHTFAKCIFLDIHILWNTSSRCIFFKAHFFPSRMMEMKGIVVGRCYQTSSA